MIIYRLFGLVLLLLIFDSSVFSGAMVIDFLRSLRTYFQQNCALKVKFLKKIRGVDGRALEGSCKFILGFYDIAYCKIDLSTLIGNLSKRSGISCLDMGLIVYDCQVPINLPKRMFRLLRYFEEEIYLSWVLPL